MRSFTDAAGRPWSIAVNVDTIKRVRGATSVDLMSVLDGTLIDRLTADPVLLVDVVYACVQPAADAAGVDSATFGSGMVGDALEGAVNALLGDLADFFPKARRLPLLAGLTKVRQAGEMAMSRATARIEAMDVASLMPPELGGTSTGSPAPAASTPAPSPGAS